MNNVLTLNGLKIQTDLFRTKNMIQSIHWLALALELTGVGNSKHMASLIWVRLWQEFKHSRKYSLVTNTKRQAGKGAIHSFIVANLEHFADRYKPITKWNKNAIILCCVEKKVFTIGDLLADKKHGKRYKKYVTGWYSQIMQINCDLKYKFDYARNKEIFLDTYRKSLTYYEFPLIELTGARIRSIYQITTGLSIAYLLDIYFKSLATGEKRQHDITYMHIDTFFDQIPISILVMHLKNTLTDSSPWCYLFAAWQCFKSADLYTMGIGHLEQAEKLYQDPNNPSRNCAFMHSQVGARIRKFRLLYDSTVKDIHDILGVTTVDTAQQPVKVEDDKAWHACRYR